MTLAERLQWILTHRGFSRRGLSLAAGLSQSHVGQLMRGALGVQVSADTLLAIARVAHVDPVWLQTGKGTPDPPPTTSPSPTSNRVRAAEIARQDGVYEMAIQHVLDEPVLPSDAERSILWWAMRMKLREVELLGTSSGRHPADPPPISKRVRK